MSLVRESVKKSHINTCRTELLVSVEFDSYSESNQLLTKSIKMFSLRLVLCIGLLVSIGSQINAEDSSPQQPSQSLLGGLIRSKGSISNVLNKELANTVDNVIGKGKKFKDTVVQKVKSKFNIFGKPSAASPQLPNNDKPLDGFKKWINDRLGSKNNTNSLSDNKQFYILLLPSSGNKNSGKATTPKPDDSSTVTPKSDIASTVTPKTDISSTATPKSDDSSTTTPKSDIASTVTPKPDISSTVTPKSDDSSTTTPKSDDSSTTTPKSDVSSATTPKSDDSSTTTPKSDVSSTTTPKSDVSSATTPKSDDSSTTTPKSDVSTTATPKPDDSSTTTT